MRMLRITRSLHEGEPVDGYGVGNIMADHELPPGVNAVYVEADQPACFAHAGVAELGAAGVEPS